MLKRSLVAIACLACCSNAIPAELTIDDGVVVKFGADAGLVVRDQARIGAGVTMTAQTEVAAGETPPPTPPAAGHWRGLRMEKSAQVGTALRGLSVRYTGAAEQPALLLRGQSPQISGLDSSHNTIGLRLQEGAVPAITGSRFKANAIGISADGAHAGAASASVTGSEFSGNGQFAIDNATPLHVLTARSNWWGGAAGPLDVTGNPGGDGDVVSTGVDYGSFAASLPLLAPSLLFPRSSNYVQSRQVTLQLTCLNATEYRVAESGSFAGVNYQALQDGRAEPELTLTEGDGLKQVTAQCRNAAGQLVSANLDGGVLLDTKSPQVAITNPAAGSVIASSIAVEATATDSSGIVKVQFYIAGDHVGTDTAAPYAYQWNNDSLTDGDYAIRAVATDQAGRTAERTVQVTLSRAPPAPDTDGPQLANVTANGIALADGATLTRSTTLAFTASDRSAISRIELLLDGALVATATGSSSYTVPLNLDAVGNGAHTLALRAIDSLNNTSTASYTINVAHAAPDAPSLTAPVNGSTTRTASTTVSGTAPAASGVQVMVNGTAAGSAVVAGSDGRFSAQITLVPGGNEIRATATDQYGTSTPSTAVNVTLDVTVPASPSALAAAVTSGKIRLTWLASSDPSTTAHDLYRSTSEFATIGEAQKVARIAKPTVWFEDQPTGDGTYYYRVVAVNAAGTPSVPTASAHATLDRSGPFAERIEYIARGTYDEPTQTFGKGVVDVKVTVNEPLLGTPYLSVVPEGALPIPVELIKRDDTHYEGVLNLAADAGTGVANVLFSARDVIGNRGVDVHDGATVRIDTVGPSVVAIAVDPVAPIKVDTSRDVSVTLTYDEIVPAASAPALQYRLSGPSRLPVTLTGAERIDATRWRVQFQLPADAGQASPEQISFASIAVDALGNQSARIKAVNEFQVYQGELPALNVPLGLKATAMPAGRVQLEWQAVEGASAYQIFRQAPGEPARTPLIRSTTASAVDDTPLDGAYHYSVASVRTSNGQESQSGESAVAQVQSSRNAPGAPQNLELSLGSQGVIATWQPPVGTAPASYRLYRSATSPITSVQGLTPIKQGIKTPQAVDAAPSQSEHAYVVTALDAAGNESAISNSGYLNFSLLPVKTLQVEQAGGQLPVLKWTANGSGAIGYDVYVGQGESRIKLTATPTTATMLTDTGYTSGERHYTVEAVDANDVRMPRALTLPNVTAQIVNGLPLKRNVMNRVGVQVSNLSASALSSAHLVLKVGAREFRSEEFVLAGNATRIVSVVVGGYPDLTNPVPLTVVVENVPHEGELVRVGRDQQVDLVDSALVVGLETEGFIRGASGKVRLSVENTSDVEVELLTARNNGSADSNELRLKLLDSDGNLLSTTPYRQATGAGVVTIASGQTVARIAPGQRYLSDQFVMPVPSTSPDQVRLRLEVDRLRYSTGQPDEVSIPGMGSERNVTLSNTPYYGEVSSAEPVMSYGTQDITILGRALDRDSGDPVPNAPLKIAINQEGFERLADVTSDTTGAFRYVFKPTLTDSGVYQVGAIHPDMTDRPDQARFTLNRINVNPQTFKLTVPRNYPYRIDFRASTGTGSQASNLRVAYLAQYQPSGSLLPGITVNAATPINIAPRQNLALPVSVSGDNTAAPSGRLVLAVMSDGSGATPLALLTVDYILTEAKPALFATPSFVQAGLSQGKSVIEKVQIENKGFVAMSDVGVTLLNRDGSAAPAWISVASNPQLGSIAVGESRSVDINVAPGAQVSEGIYELMLRVAGSNLPAEDINVFVSVTQSGIGNVLFKASDIYTATRDKNGNLIPGLAGARLFLQNEAVVSQTYELTTDAFGEAFFQNLPAGSYRFKATAQNHQEAGGRVSIKPGLTVNQTVFLDYTLISVEWSVREVTIEDRYEITLNATFETDVPAPVVMLQPASINLPKMAPGEVFQGELILTNYGLLRADGVVPQLPTSDEYFKFEFLAQPPQSLEAKQRVRLPYRVIALRSFDAPAGAAGAGAGGAGGGFAPAGLMAGPSQLVSPAGGGGLVAPSSASGTPGCFTYTNRYRVPCRYVCANGDTRDNCGSTANWFYVVSTSCPVGSNPVSGGSGGPTGGSWGGSGGPDYSGMPGLPICTKGSGDCYEPKNKQSGGGEEGGQ